MTLHERWMDEALAEARLAFQEGETPVGAVVVCGGQVLSRAHNRREQDRDPCAHAEILALRAAAQRAGRWQLMDCDLYVTLEPCPMCAGAIGQARVRRVIYGAFDKRLGCAGSVYELCGDERLGHRTQILGGVREKECAALLSAFFKARRDGKDR